MLNTAYRHTPVVVGEEEEKETEWENLFPSVPHAEETVLQAGERHKS